MQSTRRIAILVLLFAVAVPLSAQVQYTITPNRGPVAGGSTASAATSSFSAS